MGAVACQQDGDESEEGPYTDKCSGKGSMYNQGVAWGFSSMQGWRDTMEDAHIAVPSLGQWVAGSATTKADLARVRGWDATAVFGVMDGHGGAQVARFCERHLPEAIARGHSEDLTGALAAAFLEMDQMLADPSSLNELRGLASPTKGARVGYSSWKAHPLTIGCTAIVCCVRQDKLVVANAGDCRAVLCRGGLSVELSEDHKPGLPSESDRIKRAGGWVSMERFGPVTVCRVNGDLSLSRAIGDLEYKQNTALPPGDQLIVATPDVRSFKRDPSDEFLLIACDGVWDVVDSQEAVDFVRKRLGLRSQWASRINSGILSLSSILEDLLDHCISPNLEKTDGLGGDNMTAILVVFLPMPVVNWFSTSVSQAVATPHLIRAPSVQHFPFVMPPVLNQSSAANTFTILHKA